MDEGRNFPLPPTPSWAWENQVKPERVAPAAGHARDERPSCAEHPHGAGAELRTPEAAVTYPAIAGPGLPEPPAAADMITALLAARDADREQIRLQHNDIRLLVSSNKGLRREVQSWRVRSWRDEETIQALETELAQTRRARDGATQRSLLLAQEVASLRSRPWQLLAQWLRAGRRSLRAGAGGRQILAGEGPFFQRGFHLSDAVAIAGTTVKRIKDAPSGMLIFGPYVNLLAGTYAVTIDARLYQPQLVLTDFMLDVVRDGARQIVGLRGFRLHSLARWRRFELIFTVLDSEESPDFEIRVWARKGTPLEIGGIDLFKLSENPPPATATP